MSRLSALWQANPRRVLATVCALAVASAAMVTSGANFNSTSANPSVVTAGNLNHTNSAGSGSALSANKIKPGQTQTSSVTITNTGDMAGTLSMSPSGFTETANFGAKLQLVIKDGATVLYTGAFGEVTSKALGTLAPSAAKTYTFEVTFPDGGANGADNAYKAATANVTFNWELVS